MDPISSFSPLAPAKDHGSLAGRAIASYGNEIDQLLAATLQDATPSPTLGTQVDVKA